LIESQSSAASGKARHSGWRWQDVDIRAGLLRIRYQLDRSGRLVEPKTTAAKRDVPIPPSLGRMLTAHKQAAFARGQAKAIDLVLLL
jgi:hypothetical protein